jgi:hypothetical protein
MSEQDTLREHVERILRRLDDVNSKLTILDSKIGSVWLFIGDLQNRLQELETPEVTPRPEKEWLSQQPSEIKRKKRISDLWKQFT